MFPNALATRAVPAASAACRACRRNLGSSFAAMPLRAKMVASLPPMGSRAIASTARAEQIFAELPEDEPEDVLFNSLYGLRTIELNRPGKLNALNGSMIRKVGSRLTEWSKSDMANVIVMKGAGEKAFCAGGDVAQLALWNKEGPAGQKKSIEYFAREYQLDHLIATYKKPYIAFMDGFTMGGGVGLSVHAPFRIATERTVFAMPETKIGFFPDVGASFFLPRMAGETGTYLALTSEWLKGVDAFYAGIATHYLHSTSLPSLESRLAELRFQDYDKLPDRLKLVNATIEEFCTGLPQQPMTLSGRLRYSIDRCFGHSRVEDVLRSLEEVALEAAGVAEGAPEGSPMHAEATHIRTWAERTTETLAKRSPTSLHVALRQMRIGREWTISETFRREHQMAAKFMKGHDFTEGVTAVLINTDKTKGPNWKPATLQDIGADEDVARPYFLSDPNVEPLELLNQHNFLGDDDFLNQKDFHDYPYREFGLPTEADVKKHIAQSRRTRDGILAHFLHKTNGKQGVVEVLEDILLRKTYVDEEGFVLWVSEES